MKYIYALFIQVTIFSLITVNTLQAQSGSLDLFSSSKSFPTRLLPELSKGEVYLLNQSSIARAFDENSAELTLNFTFEYKLWQLDLKKSGLFSKGFFVADAGGKKQTYDTAGVLHYKGQIRGIPNSFVAISLLRTEVVGVLADVAGNINIGRLAGTDDATTHIIFREADLTMRQQFACGTDLLAPSGDLPQLQANAFSAAVLNTEPVDIYFEADYRCFQNNGNNISNTVNWATALFNVVTTLYDNDSVYTRMSGIKIWNVADPYIALTTTSSMLSAFAANMSTGFPGDLAHLLSQRTVGGGIAYLNVLCSSAGVRTAVSGNLVNSFNQLPAYSWDIMVITHELGHNIASNHTQWCGWPGGAIDNCYTTETGCPQGPAPVNGGTIMSYCHLTSYGINLMNGFGPLSGAAIRNAVRTSTCIFPKISFSTSSQTAVEEDADVNNNCRDYRIINLKLKLNYTASAPAVITLINTNVNTPGLEIGFEKDVEISPLSFTLNDTAAQIITLKVYDDAVIENKETLSIDYSIAANGTNAKKNGTYRLDILSLDHRPDSTPGNLLYYEPFDIIPTGTLAWTQTVVFGAASPNRWTINNSNDPQFSGNSAFVSLNGITPGYAGSSPADSSVIRLESPAINATGFTNLRLSYQYKCLGEGAVGQGTIGSTGLDFGRLYFSPDNGSTWTMLRDNIYARNARFTDELVLPAVADNRAALKLAFEWRNNSTVVNNPAFLFDSIVVRGTGSIAVQSNADTANFAEAYLGPNATVHFYNPVTKYIMATIANKSSHDFGCTTLELIRTGTGAAPAWGNANGSKIAEKAFRVVAANNNINAPYEIKLYYTAEEINGWISATGNNFSDLAVIKTTGSILDAPPPLQPTFSNYNSSSNYRVADKIFSGIFSGFSDFSVGKPGVTVACPGGTIQLDANETAIAFQWQANSGAGFVNLANTSTYSGTGSAVLSISNAPTSMTGYRYRCFITDAQGSHFSTEYLLRFEAEWLGTVNNLWETTGNWNCNVVPDANTDVFIKAGAPFFPTVNLSTAVRTLTLRTAAAISVVPSVIFTVLK